MTIDKIVERINYFKEKRHLSSRELSRQIGKDDSYIKKLEKTKFALSSPVLFEIIDALEVSYEEFFSPNYRTYYIDKDLYNTIIKLPEEKKKSLSDFLKK